MAEIIYDAWGGILRSVLTDVEKPGEFVVKTTVDLRDLEQNNMRLAEEHPRRSTNKLVARVPMTIWEKAYHEDWSEDDWRKWLNSDEAKPFRVWPGRV